MTFQEKVDLIGKYKDKNDKFASVYKYGKNIDSPKLNDEQKEKVRKNVEVAYNAIKQMQDKKPTKTATAKGGAKKKTMLGLASEIKKRDNVSWDEAKKRAKRDYESEKKKAISEEKQKVSEFKKQVGKIKFTRATTKTDIKKDKVLPALPSGKRYPKRGKTTNKWGTFNNNPKKPYWENRANRMDVNQPSKSVYPKLADGGVIGSGKNGYVAFYKGKRIEVYADTMYGAQKTAAKHFNAKKEWEVNVSLAEVDGKPYMQSTAFAKGGSVGDNLYVDQLASMSGARAVAVKEWSSANNLSKDDLLNIIQGLGRKQITASQFVNAVLGDKTATSEVVSYAKEGKGFKMAKGGKVDKKKYNFTILEYKDVDAVLDDELSDGDDFYGTKERAIELQEQRMQRGYCVYFTISNGEGWYYESEDLDELKESLENSDDDDFQDDDEYAKGGLIEHGLKTGDRIVSGKIIGTTIRVRNESLDEDAKVDLNTGKRTLITYDKKSKKWVEKMAQGGTTKRIKRMGC